ncbi:MAG: TetR/AcrR family transcriptional regulator [Actinocatenispora sp.]
MPRRVDHQQRRLEIAAALWRLAQRGRLEGASLNEVAAEAGISKGLVQHYFGSRDELLNFAMTHLRDRIDRRLRDSAQEAPADHRAALRAVLIALLPLDDDGADEVHANHALFNQALRDDSVATRFRAGRDQILTLIAGHLKRARDAGEIRADRQPRQEARIALSVIAGIAEAVLLGHQTHASALRTLDYHLAQLFMPHDDDHAAPRPS